MRIPLVRFGSDQTPIAEWEEQLAPVVVPVVLILLLVVLPIFMILGMILGYLTLLGYCLVGVFLPRRARAEWFAGLRSGFSVVPPRAPEGDQGGAERVVAADPGRPDGFPHEDVCRGGGR